MHQEVPLPSPTSPAPAAAEVGAAPEAAPPTPTRRGLKVGRLVVAVGLVAVVALVVLDVLVGRLAFTTRQDHRAGVYNDPTIEQPERGGPVMVLQIEEAGINLVVAEGSDGDILRGGPGLVEGSPLPGEGGNVVVMGRSTRFGGPFDFVKELVDKTEIVVRLRAGQVARYEVVDTRTVKGDDLSALEQTDEERLTLVTSAGGPFDSRRRVAVAELTGLSGTGAAAPAAGEDDGDADDGTAAPAGAEPGDGAGASTDPSASEEGSSAATTTSTVTPAEGSPESEAEASGVPPVGEEAPDRDPGSPPDSYDVRTPLAGAMFVAGILVVALGIVAIGDLRRRHPTATVVAVAGPAIALGVMLVLFNLDAFLPVSY
jgi:LPXTG-site transpeptidase (sortase) family protein